MYSDCPTGSASCSALRFSVIFALLLLTSSVMGKQDHALIAERSDLVTHGKIISQKEVLVKSGIFGVIEVIYIADINNLIYSSRISEENLSKLNMENDLKVTLKAYPTYEIFEKVESISYVGEEVNGQTFFNCIASIQDGHSNILRVGLGAESVIRWPHQNFKEGYRYD